MVSLHYLKLKFNINTTMKKRDLAYEFTPVHSWYGYSAPKIMTNGNSYDVALKDAYSRCTLTTRFPDKWRLK